MRRITLSHLNLFGGQSLDGLFRRYALALALIPDSDAAGDLFMDAGSEAALRRAAARWRRRRGLPDHDDPPLPELTAEQEQDALHLARRGQVRRRLRLGVAAAGGLLLIATALALLWGRGGLAADPAFAGRPAHMSELRSGGRLGVYRVEASPGSVTVWWELIGAAAGAGDPPRLLLSGSGGPWLEPVQHEAASGRRDRTLGRSVYQVVTGTHEAALLRTGELEVTAPMARREQEEGARSILVRRPLSLDGYLFTVDEVVAAPSYTLLRYRVTTLVLGSELRHLVRVEAGGPLEPLAPPRADGGTVEVILAPLPPGATDLAVWFFVTEGTTSTPPWEGELVSLSRDGERVTAKLRVHSHNWDPHTFAPRPFADWPWTLESTHLTDSAGRRFEGLPIYEGEDTSRHQYLWRIEAKVPESISLEELKLQIARVGLRPGLRLQIKL